MPELIALRAVFGQDEVNHGTVRYHVDGDGLVRVPREAVSYLISNGGFALAKTTVAAIAEAQPTDADPTPLVRLHHDDAGGCSYAGSEYPSDENGDVLVPPGAAAELDGARLRAGAGRPPVVRVWPTERGRTNEAGGPRQAAGSGARDERMSDVRKQRAGLRHLGAPGDQGDKSIGHRCGRRPMAGQQRSMPSARS